jgi:four helix bundle protein
MEYEAWERSVPSEMQADPLWSFRVYRTALYAGVLGRRDAAGLAKQPELRDIASQISRASVSISANIAEGYSRLGRKDRRKFYEYALGSARECRDWYFKVTDELGESATASRIALHTTLIRILLVLVSRNRPEKTT